jgi:hypothetical protein
MIIMSNRQGGGMTRAEVAATTQLEGRTVNLALVGGHRYDECQLVSVPRRRAKTFWVFTSGVDVFVPADHVLEIWESDRTMLTAR